MKAVKMEQVESAGSTEEQNTDAPKQPKSRSGHEHPNLSRCAACYNHKANSMLRWGGDGESSSSAEDSGPEEASDSEAESSSSSCSEKTSSAAGAESGGEDGREESREDKSRSKQDLPSSPAPHLTPQCLLPRPHTVVSVLHLEVLSQKNEDVAKQQENTWGGSGAGRQGINSATPPQAFSWQPTGLLWQPTLQKHLLSYHQQPHQLLQQHQQHFAPPLSAQGQRAPPPLLHTLPLPHPPTLHSPLWALNAPQTHLYAPTEQPHPYVSSTHVPYMYETH